jgi:hypothetical protein
MEFFQYMEYLKILIQRITLWFLIMQKAEIYILNWVNKHYNKFDWSYNITALLDIIVGLKKVHERQMVHCDLHTGNNYQCMIF